MIEHLTQTFALVIVLSLVCQWLGWKLRLPAILPLLICGLILGPGVGWLDPDQLLGDLLFPIVSLGVAVILFEGALTLNFKEIQDHGKMVAHLVTIGMLVTWVCVSFATYSLMGVDLNMAMLFGALVVVTGPTVIVPMLRTVRPSAKLGSILRWEGIVIDPIGALLAVLVYEYISSMNDPATHVLQAFGMTLVIGIGLGGIAGYLCAQMLRKSWVPHYLRNTAVLSLMLGIFVFSNYLEHESGLLTVTVMGIWLANTRGLDLTDIIEFKETLTVLLISTMFILLAARLDSNAVMALGWGAVGVLFVVMFIARPLSVWISGVGTNLETNEKWFLSWMAPRGIVAAAVSSLFALRLETQGITGGEFIVPLVFSVIISTVVVQSLTTSAWASWLKVKMDSPQGLLIFGASDFTRQFSKILLDRDIPVMLADTNWENIRVARMENIPVYYGNPASEHAENHLDLTGIGRVLVMSPYQRLNPVISFYYQDVFGEHKVLMLNQNEGQSARLQMAENYLGQGLFGDSLTYAKIASLVAKGGIVKTTQLTDTFNLDSFYELYGESAIPLAFIKEGKLVLATSEAEFTIEGEAELISLLPAEALEK